MINGIDRKSILKLKIDQKAVFQFLGYNVDLENFVFNPERNDKTPKCTFKWHKGYLIFSDFTGFFGKTGITAFEAYQFRYKKSFSLKEKELNEIIKYEDFSDAHNKDTYSRSISIKFKNKPWPTKHYLFDIPSRILHQENIFLVSEYWCNTSRHKTMVMNRFNNPMKSTTIAYLFRDLKSRVKLYFVGNSLKFYTNIKNKDIFGLKTLRKTDNTLFITKSGADYLCLKYVLGYNAIALNSEWPSIEESVLTKIKSFNYDHIVILYDNDMTGIKNSIALRNFLKQKGMMNIRVAFLPEKVEKKDCKDCKDLYYINKLKLKKVLKLIKDGKFFEPTNFRELAKNP